MEKVRFTSYMNKETQEKLKELHKQTRVPMSAYVEEAITDLLLKYEETTKKENESN